MQNNRVLTIQDIFQYLQSKRFHLSSDKVLKEPEKYPDVIGDIYKILSQSFFDQKYHRLADSLGQLLNHQKHSKSSMWIKQQLYISDIFYKLRIQYRLIDFFKPEKERTLANCSKLIQAQKFKNKIQKKYQFIEVDYNTNMELKNKLQKQNNQLKEQLQIVKAQKNEQLPLYTEKMQNIQYIQNEINDKKTQKLDLNEAQNQLNAQLTQQKEKKEEMKYFLQSKKRDIVKLKKEVVKNLPEKKSQKIQIEDQFVQLKDTNYKSEAQFTSLLTHTNFQAQQQFKLAELQINKLDSYISFNNQEHDYIQLSQQLNKRINTFQQRINQINHKENENNSEAMSIHIQSYELFQKIKGDKSIEDHQNNFKNDITTEYYQNNQSVIDYEKLVFRHEQVYNKISQNIDEIQNNYQQQKNKLRSQYINQKEYARKFINEIYNSFQI